LAQGADATLAAYRALRAGGLRVTPDTARMVMRGVQGPAGGGSPRRALTAAAAFLKDGVPPGRRAWNALMCAASAAPDLKALAEGAAAMAAAGDTPNSITHLALAQGALISGDVAAATAALNAATALAPALVRPSAAQPQPDIDVMGTLARVMAVWAEAIPAGAATPGGAEGLAARTREALAAAGGRIPLDVDAVMGKLTLLDGPCAPPAAAAQA
jgi:hypothetical protein